MAYLNHLLSVPAEQLFRCKSWKLLRTHASHEVGCSHLLGYWWEFDPLRDALGQAWDGGSACILAGDTRFAYQLFTSHPKFAASRNPSSRLGNSPRTKPVNWLRTTGGG